MKNVLSLHEIYNWERACFVWAWLKRIAPKNHITKLCNHRKRSLIVIIFVKNFLFAATMWERINICNLINFDVIDDFFLTFGNVYKINYNLDKVVLT